VKRYDIGMTEGRIWRAASRAAEPRRLDLVGVEARDEPDAEAKLRTKWRALYGDGPSAALIGISRAY
jgi:hypothetical protein